jgi:cystathionine beta-lyase
MGRYDFDRVVNRKGTNSAKWHDNCGNVTPLSVADMDIPAPPQIVARLRQLNEKGIYGYTDLSGDWQRIVAEWNYRRYQWPIEPDWAVFCPRVVNAIALYLQHFTRRNDKVVMLSPSYGPISRLIVDNQRQLSASPLRYQQQRYQIDFDDLDRRLAGASCFILLSPHNPTGTIWQEDVLLKISALCEKHGVFIISDDVHADFCFAGQRYRPIAALSDYVREHSMVCASPSKTFNLAGLETAVVIIANPTTRAHFEQAMAAAGFHNPGYFSAAALEIAYRDCDDWLDELCLYLFANRTFAAEVLAQTGFEVCQSAGTYLLWVNYQNSGLTEPQLKTRVFDPAGVEVTFGSAFGSAGAGFFRINVALPREPLMMALENIKNHCNLL